MQIIKPYGRSHVESNGTGATRRVVRARASPLVATDIEKFVQSNDRLVIAQWISVIDKIGRKPAGTNGPTPEQRAFRALLGNSAWIFLETNGLLSGLTDPALKEQLWKFWKAKIAPYGTTPYRAPNRTGKEPPSAKGRWYDRFIGDLAVTDVDGAAVAQRIHEHLYRAEYRISSGAPNRRLGRIVARARSITVNVPRPDPPVRAGGGEIGWTTADRETYACAGNVAQQIRLAAQRRERGEDKGGARVTTSVAAAELFKHYAKVFSGQDGIGRMPHRYR